MAVLEPQAASSMAETLDSPTRLSGCFEELDRAYANRRAFVDDSRRLTEEGWMIARLSERQEQQSIIARILGVIETHFDVTYERLVRHFTGEAAPSALSDGPDPGYGEEDGQSAEGAGRPKEANG